MIFELSRVLLQEIKRMILISNTEKSNRFRLIKNQCNKSLYWYRFSLKAGTIRPAQ